MKTQKTINNILKTIHLDQPAPQQDRRSFLKLTGLSGIGAFVGMTIPFGKNLPSGVVPVAFAQDTGTGLMSGKPGLTLLNDKPLNAETPSHLLDEEVTPY